MTARDCRRARGMTLLELVVVLAITAVIVVALAGSVRVAVRAWEAGERRTALQQEVRAVVELVTEALASAYPYRGRAGTSPERVVLFQGESAEVRFVTSAPPLGLDAPAAPFHAVVLGRDDGDRLRVAERLVPSSEPFTEGTETVLSRSVTQFRLDYMDDKGAWLDRWDGATATGLPAAVRVELAVRGGGRTVTVPALVVPLVLGKRES